MVTDDRTCYFPSGATAPGNVPCVSDKNTWCCGIHDICLDNGLCLNTGHQPYVLSRGACTNKGWLGCTNYCKNSTPDKGASISNIFFNGSTALYCCGSPIVDGDNVSCPPSSDNNGEPFTVTTGKVIAGRAILANVSSLSNKTSAGTSSSIGAGSDTGNCRTCHDTAIGAGVGVPLGVLALLFMIWAIIERRRKASRLSRALSAPGPAGSIPVTLQSENSELFKFARKRNNMAELEGGRPELDGGDSMRQ